MPVALTVYETNNAATTLTTAALMVANATGALETGQNTALGTATGYGEFVWRSTASAWAAAGAIGSPDGKGALYDTTALEGLSIVAGTWTPTVRGNVVSGNGNVTADLSIRAYVYNATSLTYTAIGTCTLAAQTLTSTTTTFAFAGTSLPAAAFGTGDKLYIDFWLDVTANANTLAGAGLRFDLASSTTLGNVTNQIVTPGYVVAGAAALIANAVLSATGIDLDTPGTVTTSDAPAGVVTGSVSAAGLVTATDARG